MSIFGKKENAIESFFGSIYDFIANNTELVCIAVAILVAIFAIRWTQRSCNTAFRSRDGGVECADMIRRQWVLSIVIVILTVMAFFFTVYTVGASIPSWSALTIGIVLGLWAAYNTSTFVRDLWTSLKRAFFAMNSSTLIAMVIGVFCILPTVALGKIGYDLNGQSTMKLLIGLGLVATALAVWGPIRARYANQTNTYVQPVLTLSPVEGKITE
jgi:ABC-type Fe3+ transport system permease subunit